MNTDQLYQERLSRYVAAMRNEKPDRVPIRPFVAEFTATYTGMTCQEVVHDYRRAFEAAVRCAQDFDWDAVVPNMVYVWTGLTQAMNLRYYGIPGICYGPAGEGAHAFDERAYLPNLKETTVALAAFIAEWCGTRPA